MSGPYGSLSSQLVKWGGIGLVGLACAFVGSWPERKEARKKGSSNDREFEMFMKRSTPSDGVEPPTCRLTRIARLAPDGSPAGSHLLENREQASMWVPPSNEAHGIIQVVGFEDLVPSRIKLSRNPINFILGREYEAIPAGTRGLVETEKQKEAWRGMVAAQQAAPEAVLRYYEVVLDEEYSTIFTSKTRRGWVDAEQLEGNSECKDELDAFLGQLSTLSAAYTIVGERERHDSHSRHSYNHYQPWPHQVRSVSLYRTA